MREENIGRVAIVTGGGRGIGRGIVARLAADGMQVVIADRDTVAAAATVSQNGPKTLAVPTDVADETSVAALMEQVRDRFGRLDVLINNAGIAKAHAVPLEELSLRTWQELIDINLTGIFLCCKHAIPLLRAQRGSIVNIASTRAFQSEPHTEAYSASKGGVVALTHALAISLGPQIRANCISPGWIAVADRQKSADERTPHLTPTDHDQHPVGRVGRPEDIAALVAYLIAPEAGFITGQNFIVDGGMTRKMIYAD